VLLKKMKVEFDGHVAMGNTNKEPRDTSANNDSRNVDNAVSRSAIARGVTGSCS